MTVVNVDREEYPPEGKDVKAFGPSADRLVVVSIGIVEELAEEEGVEEVGRQTGETRACAVS